MLLGILNTYIRDNDATEKWTIVVDGLDVLTHAFLDRPAPEKISCNASVVGLYRATLSLKSHVRVLMPYGRDGPSEALTQELIKKLQCLTEKVAACMVKVKATDDSSDHAALLEMADGAYKEAGVISSMFGKGLVNEYGTLVKKALAELAPVTGGLQDKEWSDDENVKAGTVSCQYLCV